MFHKFGLEIIQIVVFHLMIESIQIFGFFKIFGILFQIASPILREALLSGSVFRKKDGLT